MNASGKLVNAEENEQLSRQLTVGQLGMIALGGAIGTGLFLGSSLAVHTAGPAVILSYLLGAGIAVLLMRSLTEMAVAHPAAGSFGLYAGIYLNPWAGFAVRYTYWAAQCVAIGGEAAAIAIYCQWWLPGIPKWVWILAFTAALLYVNARSVGSFGSFEYWFSMIKVVAIVLFIVFGVALIIGAGSKGGVGLSNLTAHGGFFAKGWSGVWMAMVFVIFSYIGTEVVAVAAGEAKDPTTALPKAIRSMAARLILFYLCAIVVLLCIVPWNEIQPGAQVTASPFVRVFQYVGVPAAAHVVNFVVITAAASSMNCNFYLVSRMLYSLARSGYAPAAWGHVSGAGTPVRALLISGAGLGLAVVTAFFFPDSVFVYLFGVSLFGGLFTWLAIFVTHWFFRRKRGMAADYLSLLGAAAVFAILLTTWVVPGMRITLLAGLPWIAVLTAAYFGAARRRPADL
ncbi:MAG: amino acid permease [Bryobacteraceae bacterium]